MSPPPSMVILYNTVNLATCSLCTLHGSAIVNETVLVGRRFCRSYLGTSDICKCNCYWRDLVRFSSVFELFCCTCTVHVCVDTMNKVVLQGSWISLVSLSHEISFGVDLFVCCLLSAVLPSHMTFFFGSWLSIPFYSLSTGTQFFFCFFCFFESTGTQFGEETATK
jgi:hypothetical protein